MTDRRLLPTLALVAGLAMTVGMAAPATLPWRLLFIAGSVGLSVVMLLAWRSGRVSLPTVLCVGVLLRLIVLPIAPTLSDDVWRYLWDGLVTATGGNPYLSLPSDSINAELSSLVPLDRLNSGRYYSVYPPVSQYLFATAGTAIRFFGSAMAGLIVLKLVALLCELLVLWLLVCLKTPATLVVLYAWNPLVIVETVGQMHSEAFMLPLLVGTIAACRGDRLRLAGVLLAAATWVKLFPLLLLPLLWRRGGWRSVWPQILTLALLALPFYHGNVVGNVRQSILLYATTFDFNAGLYLLLRAAVNALHEGPENVGRDVVGPALQIVLLAGVVLIYAFDWWKKPSLAASFALVLGLFVVTATTVHPWYLLGLLALLPLQSGLRWSWLWLAAIAPLTYLRYLPAGESTYFAAVAVGWSGWLGLSAVALLPAVLRKRARSKATRVEAAMGTSMRGRRILDLGCGEGHVGEALRSRGADVSFCDVADFSADTARPFIRYNGSALPFGDTSFDVIVLYFVLHHSRDAEQVLSEAARVGSRVVVVESVYRTAIELRVLTFLDKLANRLRGGQQMAAQEEHLHFRKVADWLALMKGRGLTADYVEEHGRSPHRQATFVLRQQQLL